MDIRVTIWRRLATFWRKNDSVQLTAAPMG
jgi:hypothetical protein